MKKKEVLNQIIILLVPNLSVIILLSVFIHGVRTREIIYNRFIIFSFGINRSSLIGARYRLIRCEGAIGESQALFVVGIIHISSP